MAPTTPNPQSAGSVSPPAAGATSGAGQPSAQSAQTDDKDLAQRKGDGSDLAAKDTEPTAVAKFDSKGGKERRILTKKDFTDNAILDSGVKGDLVWGPENNFVVDVSDLSDEALDFLHKTVEGVTIKRAKQDQDA